ncbi:uncharacterized protein LOC135848816 [Planococcus citri]|uniref:uncharacterized protein LOC135848816 n=1 Tax=Planococcus citri TaxID=170843 RepID=UPI0031F867BC
MLMSLILMQSFNCLLECVSEMVKNYNLTPFRSRNYQKHLDHRNTTSAHSIPSVYQTNMPSQSDLRTAHTSLIAACDVSEAQLLEKDAPNGEPFEDRQKQLFHLHPNQAYSLDEGCDMQELFETYQRNVYPSVKNQEILARERLQQIDQQMERKLEEMRDQYKQVCLEVEAKKAAMRIQEVKRDTIKDQVISLDQQFVRLPEPLNRAEKEAYVDYLIINILHDLHDINNVAMGELLDDDVITTVMEACQEKHPDILFVNPCITQCIQFSQDNEVVSFLEPIEAKKYDNIFFVINDTSNGSRGTHWSLLLLSKDMEAFCHYDSLKGMNYKIALELSKKLSEYFEVYQIFDVDCEQQTNNTDCGIYVLDNMSRIILILKNEFKIEDEIITPLKISKLPPSFTKTRIYMMNTYINSILQKIKRTFRVENMAEE